MDIIKEKIVETLYRDFISVANDIFYSQLNFLIEFGPGWFELTNITSLRHDFSTISFEYSLTKTLDNEDILFKALRSGTIRTIYLFSFDRFKFFPPILNRALSILKLTSLLINFNSLPARPQIINKKKQV